MEMTAAKKVLPAPVMQPGLSGLPSGSPGRLARRAVSAFNDAAHRGRPAAASVAARGL
ncbi:MAG: hypothetical protein QOG14_1372 [Mycobacterium sp.]|nr:hypothetical protein [Mycobacterium sp.]